MDAHRFHGQDCGLGPTWGLVKQSMKAPTNLTEARINQEAIGAGLRQMFDEVVNEPIPDEFLELLRRADERFSPGEPDLEAGI